MRNVLERGGAVIDTLRLSSIKVALILPYAMHEAATCLRDPITDRY